MHWRVSWQLATSRPFVVRGNGHFPRGILKGHE
jgi:hypothetical protein